MDYKILKKDKLDKIISNSSVKKGSTVIDIVRNLTYDRKQNINYLDIYFEINIDELLKEKIVTKYESVFSIVIMHAYKYDKISCCNFCIPKDSLYDPDYSKLLYQTLNEGDYYIFGSPSAATIPTYTVNIEKVTGNNWRIDSLTYDNAEFISCYINDTEITKENASTTYFNTGILKIKVRRFYHNRYVNMYKYDVDMTLETSISKITKRLYSNYENDFKTLIKIMPASYAAGEAGDYQANYIEMCDSTHFPHYYNLICLPQKFDDAYIVYENDYKDNIEDFYNDYVISGWNTVISKHISTPYYITYQYSNIGYLSGICNTLPFRVGAPGTISTWQEYDVRYGNPLLWSFKPTYDCRYKLTVDEYKAEEPYKKCKSFRTITCKTSYDIDNDYEYINYIDYNNLYRKKWGNILKQTTTVTIDNELRNSILGLPNSFTTWR